MNTTSNTYQVLGLTIKVISNGNREPNFWLSVNEEVSTPLPTVYDEDGMPYAYFWNKKEKHEVRIYATGEVI